MNRRLFASITRNGTTLEEEPPVSPMERDGAIAYPCNDVWENTDSKISAIVEHVMLVNGYRFLTAP